MGLTLAAKQAASTARTSQPSTGAAMSFELLDGRRAGYLLLKLTRPTGTIQNLICHPTDEKPDPRNREVAVGGGR